MLAAEAAPPSFHAVMMLAHMPLFRAEHHREMDALYAHLTQPLPRQEAVQLVQGSRAPVPHLVLGDPLPHRNAADADVAVRALLARADGAAGLPAAQRELVQAVRAVPRGSRSRGRVASAQGDGGRPAELESVRVADVSARAARSRARSAGATSPSVSGSSRDSPAAQSRSSDVAGSTSACRARGRLPTDADLSRRACGAYASSTRTLSDGVAVRRRGVGGSGRAAGAARARVGRVDVHVARVVRAARCGRIPRGRARPSGARTLGQADRTRGATDSPRWSRPCAR